MVWHAGFVNIAYTYIPEDQTNRSVIQNNICCSLIFDVEEEIYEELSEDHLFNKYGNKRLEDRLEDTYQSPVFLGKDTEETLKLLEQPTERTHESDNYGETLPKSVFQTERRSSETRVKQVAQHGLNDGGSDDSGLMSDHTSDSGDLDPILEQLIQGRPSLTLLNSMLARYMFNNI